MLSRTSLLEVSLCTLVWYAGKASSHVIQRTSIAYSSEEPVFTIQTSMPSLSTTTTSTPARECFSNGSTFLCPTSTQSGEEDPVFCPAPTRIPSGLCFSTITYTITPTQAANSNANESGTATPNITVSTTVRTYPCAEKTTTYLSATYALNCLDEEANYITCPTNITLTPTPTSTISKTSSSFPTTLTTILDCFDDAGSTVSCSRTSSASSSISTACLDANCTITPTPTSTSSTIQRTRSIISQCFDLSGIPTSCPVTCESPFETAPGPVIPTASLTLESQSDISSSTSSEKIFRTSPAPMITSFASVPAFLSTS